MGVTGTELTPNSPKKTGVPDSGLHFGLHFSPKLDPAALAAAIDRLSDEQRAAILACTWHCGRININRRLVTAVATAVALRPVGIVDHPLRFPPLAGAGSDKGMNLDNLTNAICAAVLSAGADW